MNQVLLDEAGLTRSVIIPNKEVARRQAALAVYDIVTVAYTARPEFVLGAPSLMAGRVRAVVIPRERVLDIDTELDFRLAEFMMSLKREGALKSGQESERSLKELMSLEGRVALVSGGAGYLGRAIG